MTAGPEDGLEKYGFDRGEALVTNTNQYSEICVIENALYMSASRSIFGYMCTSTSRDPNTIEVPTDVRFYRGGAR